MVKIESKAEFGIVICDSKGFIILPLVLWLLEGLTIKKLRVRIPAPDTRGIIFTLIY